jgi:hypothetical protein
VRRSSYIFILLLHISLTAGHFEFLPAQSKVNIAQKFDEFGDIQESDLKARLDNFAVQLQNDESKKGFILVYRSRRDLPGLSHSLALHMKDYLLATRGLSESRIVIVDGGVAMCLTQELWIVPAGSAPTPRSDSRIGYFQYSDEAWKFFEYGFLPAESNKRFFISHLNGADAEYLEAYANEVKKKRSYQACVIVYAQYDPRPGLVDYYGTYEPVRDVRLDPPGVARQRLELEKRYLKDIYGIPASRIRTIDGGYRKRRSVELWIVPSDERLPTPTPNSFPRPQARLHN